MRILLLGEYSNVHWTLAEGLRKLGHEVCVASDGDGWKNYKRDISLARTNYTPLGGLFLFLKILFLLPKFRKYDVVQLINPCFLELKPGKNAFFYRCVKRLNKKVFMGAFGVDYYWVKMCRDTNVLAYSDFKIFGKTRETEATRRMVNEWIEGPKGRLNKEIAASCDGIIGSLYQYYISYQPYFPDKTTFISFPLNLDNVKGKPKSVPERVRFFIGIQKQRNEIKGTDIMLRALERVQADYPNDCEIVKVESVPFETYQELMDNSDVILDQLYSYSSAMNALLAMSKGLVVVGGAEKEFYEILSEKELRPIINVVPDEDDVYRKLEDLVLNKEKLAVLSEQSIEFVHKHHNYLNVAQQYVDFWQQH